MRHALSLLLVVAAGCAGMRAYQLPLTPSEAPLVFPALVATAQAMGLEATQWPDRVNVTLEDGSKLAWVADAQRFALWITIDEKSAPGGELDAKLREVKVRADQIWDLAIEARQKSNVGAAVVIPPGGSPPAPSQQARPSSRHTPAASLAPAAPSSGACRSGLDCGSGQFCKDRGDGVRVCMGNGGPGAPCASGVDCGSGLFCRDRGGLKVCAD